MKKTMLLAMGLSAFIASTTTQTFAQAHSHFVKIPPTVEEISAEIGKQQTSLAAIVAKKDLGGAHDHAFAIRDLVKALPGKVAAESKAKAEAAAVEIAKIAADIDKSGAGGAQNATEANVKKMDAAVTALQADLKTK